MNEKQFQEELDRRLKQAKHTQKLKLLKSLIEGSLTEKTQNIDGSVTIEGGGIRFTISLQTYTEACLLDVGVE